MKSPPHRHPSHTVLDQVRLDKNGPMCDHGTMLERSRNMKTADLNHLAASSEEEVTGEGKSQFERAVRKKNPAAVALGRHGGKKGGLARAAKLTVAQRVRIAKLAAAARWSKRER